ARIEGITIEEYLAIEDKKMTNQSMNSSLRKLWYLADEDDEEENNMFDMNEFLAIQTHNNLSPKSIGTHESLDSTLDEKYDAIACDFPPKLEFLLASESRTDVSVYSLDTFKEEHKENSNLEIYEPRQCYYEYERIFAEVVILTDNILVKLIDITLEQWLDLKFGDHKKVDKEIMEAFKFNNHKTMDWYTKNALWLYRKRDDDEEVLAYDEFYDLKEENLREEDEIAKVFRIDTDIFFFETPPCKEFKEYNHLLQIYVDVLTIDLHGFKTYDDYKDIWYYEWNIEVLWVDEKPWLEDGI
nr:hypothetical protein [Tanacetum cinerariifolium]